MRTFVLNAGEMEILFRQDPYSGSPLIPFFQIRRGVGSGFIPISTNADSLAVDLLLHGLVTNRTIFKQSNLTWTSVSGVLASITTWTNHSRIQVAGGITIPNGSTLNIGEGTIVLLNSRVDITNNGTVNVNGTTQNPVVFMPTVSSGAVS